MAKLIPLVVAALLLVSCRSTPTLDRNQPVSGEVVAVVEWRPNDRIGAAESAPLAWEDAGNSRAATIPLDGDTLRLIIAPADEDAKPERWRWVRGDGDGEDQSDDDGVAIPWSTVIQDRAFRALLEITSDNEPPLTIDLRWTEGTMGLTATASRKLAGRAAFKWRGIPHEAWFVDADLDGALGGPLDRWVAGPSSRLAGIKFSSPSVEMRPLDEPWCVGEFGVTFRDWKDGAVQLEMGPPLDRSLLRSRHHARLVDEFFSNMGLARAKFLGAQGEADPDRPTTPEQAPWVYVDTWEEAMAQRIVPNRPLIVEFTTTSCMWCHFLTWATHADAEVDEVLRRFTRVKIDVQFVGDPATRQILEGTPRTVLVGKDGEFLDVMKGFKPPTPYLETLRDWLERPM